eukprot:132790-Chlamydomonas_euryale.AAC.1
MAGTEGALGTDAQPDRGEGVRLDRGGAAERGAPASGVGQPARAQHVRVRGRQRASLGGAAGAQGHHHLPTHPTPPSPIPNSPAPLLPS